MVGTTTGVDSFPHSLEPCEPSRRSRPSRPSRLFRSSFSESRFELRCSLLEEALRSLSPCLSLLCDEAEAVVIPVASTEAVAAMTIMVFRVLVMLGVSSNSCFLSSTFFTVAITNNRVPYVYLISIYQRSYYPAGRTLNQKPRFVSNCHIHWVTSGRRFTMGHATPLIDE